MSSSPTITRVHLLHRLPAPSSSERLRAERNVLDLKDTEGGFRAGPFGISYRHTDRTFLAPWSVVKFCELEAEAPEKKASSKASSKKKGEPAQGELEAAG